MALEKTWQFDTSRVLSVVSSAEKAKNMIWYIKAFLKGEIGGATGTGLWTCHSSSDSATANLAGTDLWGAAFDPTKLVRASAGVAHSWIVLQSPAGLGPYYLTLDYVSTQDYQIDITISRNAPTGGSITARPTSTNEVTVANRQVTENATNAQRCHGRLTSEGAFFILGSKDGSGFFNFGLAFSVLADRKTEDATYTGWLYTEYLAGGVFQSGTLGAMGALFMGRSFSGGATVNQAAIYPATTSGAIFATISGADATNNKYNDFPIFIAMNTSWRGRWPDWKWTHLGLADGDVEPLVGTPERMVVGETWVPTNQAPSL